MLSSPLSAPRLQPNSPESRVTQALSSPNKSRQLARRIFYSFARDPDVMRLEGKLPSIKSSKSQEC